MTKKIGIILGIILITILSFTTINYAVHDNNGKFLGLMNNSTERESGLYTFNSKPIFKIVEYTSNQGIQKENSPSIYCLRGGVGFGSDNDDTVIRQYTEYFDIKNPDSIIPEEYRNQLPTDMNIYNKLVWVLDHLYIPAKDSTAEEIALGKESKENLLNEAGVDKSSFLWNDAVNTQDILECIQQVAIWHYTQDISDPTQSPYYNPHNDRIDLWLNGSPIDQGDIVEGDLDIVYKYLIQGAENAVQAGYTYKDAITNKEPINFIKDSSAVSIEDTNYIVGPYKIEELSNIEYTLDATITDGTHTISNAKILDQNKTEITSGNSIAEKISTTIGTNFYISIPISSNINQVKINVNANYYSTTQTMWTVGANSLYNNQPVVIVSRDKLKYEADDIKQITSPEFDLALRKFIVEINGERVKESREPNIIQANLKKLATGNADFDNGTTVPKTHTKTPLLVENGDKIVYTIRIYNEGDIDGYAKEIIDYLPEGLELVDPVESTINQKYGWTKKETSAGNNAVSTTYLANEQISKFNKAPTDGKYELNYEDVQIECKVVKQTTEQDISLKNVAEISISESSTGEKTDRDSKVNNVEENVNNYLPGTSEEGKGYEDDDDYEELVIIGKNFDLSLRKFITAVNDQQITNREPSVNVNPLLTGQTTANYNHTKNPVSVSAGDTVTYTIRVYNEGQINGYVQEIVDHLPPELEFIIDDPLNIENGWIIDNSDETQRTIKTNILSKENDTDNVIKAFDTNNSVLSYKEVRIKCKVRDTAPTQKQITNIAEITSSINDAGLIDRDNVKNVTLPSDDELPNYRADQINQGLDYIPGQEDDDDFEKIILEKFDLALRKFITGVNEEEITNRIPEVDTSKYGQTGEDGKVVTNFTYNHTKEAVRVSQNDIVTYTIRVYNEGTQPGYVAEIKDDIPEGLIYLPENEINQEYMWKMYDGEGNETKEISKAKYIRSTYLSKENEKVEGENLLKGYDAETMEGPEYREVKVAFKVGMPNTSDRIIINKAEISKDSDKNGEEVTDIDSVPDKWNEGEDDQDIEKIYVKYFDLALRKWVSEVIVIEDGVEKVKETGHYAEQDPEPVVRVDLNEKRINNTIIKFKYQIRITNEGEIAGYATEISDYIPEGLEFNQADNPKWKEVEGKIVTDQLKDTLLQPGEQATVEVILTWINDEENMGVMINTAEISEDYNESKTPDIDSVPNNKKEGEDDIDDAPVALTMVTGKAPMYIGITAGTLVIIAGGVFLIKKYVI